MHFIFLILFIYLIIFNLAKCNIFYTSHAFKKFSEMQLGEMPYSQKKASKVFNFKVYILNKLKRIILKLAN